MLKSTTARMKRFIDIGANLTDRMYQGEYNFKKKHEEDLDKVLSRCWEGNMQKMIITGGSYADCQVCLTLSEKDDRLYTTIGCHPTRCREFGPDPKQYWTNLKRLILDNEKKVVAIGECGLDYERQAFCDKETQIKFFVYQLQLCRLRKLPLFLHCRSAWDDFFKILKDHEAILFGGVVHSFDGSLENMEKAVEMGYHIGINGCSLKTEENLSVAAQIPLERLLVETDCPWCEIRPSHAGYQHIKTHFPSVKKEKYAQGFLIKGRNEPLNIIQVLEVLAAIRNADLNELCEAVYQNTLKLFFPESNN